jgi:hypothetical protein
MVTDEAILLVKPLNVHFAGSSILLYIFVRLLQPQNAFFPMFVSVEGKVRVVSAEHSLKTFSAMDVTL